MEHHKQIQYSTMSTSCQSPRSIKNSEQNPTVQIDLKHIPIDGEELLDPINYSNPIPEVTAKLMHPDRDSTNEGEPNQIHDDAAPIAHLNFDKEKRRLVEEAKRFIDSPHELGRTRSRTNSREKGEIKQTGDATGLSFNSSGNEASHDSMHIKSAVCDRHSSTSVSWTNSTFVTEPSKSLSREERESSFNKELKVWQDREAYKWIEKSNAPPNSNVILSHVVYRRKDDGSAKVRTVPLGPRSPS